MTNAKCEIPNDEREPGNNGECVASTFYGASARYSTFVITFVIGYFVIGDFVIGYFVIRHSREACPNRGRSLGLRSSSNRPGA